MINKKGCVSTMKKCCICNAPITSYGNNPYPIKDKGVCCDNCNIYVVIPKRMEMLVGRKEKKGDD